MFERINNYVTEIFRGPFYKTGAEESVMRRTIWKLGPEKEDCLTGEDLMRGVSILGGIGSGKSSGSGRSLAASLLKNGFGGLVLCVKHDEADTWRKYAEESGRHDDFVFFGKSEALGFNFLEYEKRAGDGSPFSMANYYLEIAEVISGTVRKSSDSFWEESLKQLVQNLMTIEMARNPESLTAAGLRELYEGVGRKKKGKSDEIEPPDPKLGLHTLEPLAEHDRELKLALRYLKDEFPRLAPNTRSVIENSFVSQLDSMLREPLHSKFQSKTTVSPDDILKGKVVVVEMSVHEYKFLGRLANLIWKNSFMRAVERRKDKETPVFLWMDEYQQVASPNDSAFQATARSNKCATVAASQSIPGYSVVLQDKNRVFSLLTNLNIKVFHQNNDPETNRYATTLIPDRLKTKTTYTIQTDGKKVKNISKVREPEVTVEDLYNLKSGGGKHPGCIEAIVTLNGHKFSNNRAWKKVKFGQ